LEIPARERRLGGVPALPVTFPIFNKFTIYSIFILKEANLRFKLGVFSFFIVIYLPVISHAAELTLDDAVSRGVEFNLNLQKQKIDIAASSYSEKNIWSDIFPSINAEARFGYGSSLFSGKGFEFNEKGVESRINLGINFAFNAGLSYTMKSIRLAHQSNVLKYEDAVNQLSIQITKKYFSLIAEKNNLLLLEEMAALSQRQLARSEVSFRNGLTGELQLMQSRLAMENARYNLSAARMSHNNNMAEFIAMIGGTHDPAVTLSGEIKIKKIDADAQSLIDRHLHLRPDIVRSKQEIERLEFAYMQSVMQSKSPQLSVSFNWNTTFNDPITDRLAGTAALSIPIDSWIPGSSRSQTVSRAKDAIEKAKIDLAITEDSAITQIRSLAALLRGSWDSIMIARLSMETADRSYQLTELGFQNGRVEALALEDVRNNLANTRFRLLQAELSYFNMILDLCSALNVDWKQFIENISIAGELNEKK